MAGLSKRGRPPHPDVLTPAEWRIVDAVRHGMSNRQIARRRGISLDAVKYHVRNAVAKLGLENRRALRYWRGASMDSALKLQEGAMTTTRLEIGPIGQISRSVRDIGQAEDWYKNVLGLEHLYTFGKLCFFDCAGTRLYLSQESDEPTPESVLYFRVPDIEAAYEKLRSRGVEFTGAPHRVHRHDDGTEEWMAFFNDPERRPLALMSQVRPSSAEGDVAG